MNIVKFSKVIVPFILIIFLVESLSAQDEVLDKYTSGTVFNLKKDSKGRIWMATDRGLYVSDGINYIKILTGDQEITNSAIVELVLHNNNLFLIYREKGVIKIDINTLSYKKITDKKVANIIIENDKELYILYANGSLYHTFLNQQKYNFNLINQFEYSSDNLPLMTNFSKNYLIISLVNKGMYKVNKRNGRIEKSYGIKPSGNNKFIHLGKRIFFLNKDILFELNNVDKFFKSNYVKDNSNISSIIPISDTEKVIIKYKKNIFFEKNRVLRQLYFSKQKNHTINDAIYNSSENILFATNQGIINILSIEKKVKPLFDSIIQMNDYINVRSKILPYKNNKIILMGFPLPHLYDFNENKFTPLTKKYNATYDAILKDDIIFATAEGGGIKKIDINTKEISNVITKDIDTVRFYSAVCDIENILQNHILFGRRGAVIIYDYIKNTSREFNLNINIIINSIKVDSATQLAYLATNQGIYVLDILNNKISKKTLIPSTLISDLEIMQTKNTSLLWFISDEGLTGINLLNNKIEIHLDLLNFNNNKLTALISDLKGRIWVSTFSGLYAYEYPINNIIKLDTRNGVINNEFSAKSTALMQNGELIFGGLNGYDIINANSFNFNGNPIKGNILGYSIYNSKNRIYHHFNPKESIQYNTSNNYIQLYFSLNEFEKFNYSEFEYQIDNEKWMSLYGLSFLYMYKLKDGLHTVKIRGYDESGNPIIFDLIKINYFTDFYQSENFKYILFSAVFFLLLLTIFINYNNYNKLNRIKNNIAMDLHDEIGTLLNRTLFTLKNDSKNENKNIVIQYLTEAMYSVRTYIKAFNVEKISTHQMVDEFKELVSNFSNNEGIKYILSYNFDKEYFISSNEYRDFKLITYEINQNILKHSKANNIITKINIYNNCLITIVEDDGCLKNINKIKNNGNGILNIMKRVKRLNGNVNFSINAIGNGLKIELKFYLS